MLSERERGYVEAAQATGVTPAGIVFRHLLPNIMAPIIVIANVRFAWVIILEASLSFLGAGFPAERPSLGLLESVPSTTRVTERIKQIPGVMPSLQDLPTGCSFRPRCEFCRTPECLETPPLREVSPGRWVACHFPRG